jgi:Calcium binding
MTERPVDKDREERIRNEIVVDAYDREEQVMGWCAYPISRSRWSSHS